MEFYCPKCQQIVVQSIEKTVTTKGNVQVAIANCQICNQEITQYGVSQVGEANANV